MNSQDQSHQTEEIDLGYFFKQISNFLKAIVRLCFKVLDFIKKKIIWILLLVIGGAIFGYFSQKKSVTLYQNKLIVIPNFESADYLYEKVDEINFKIKQKDSAFIKQFTGSDWRHLVLVEIEAVPDIYNFITTSREHIDVFRILFENQEMSEFVKDVITSKQYKYHKLNFHILGNNSKVIIKKVLEHLNTNEHFNQYKKAYLDNTTLRITATDRTVKKIDSILSGFAVIPQPGTNQMPQVNANSDMSEIAALKEKLLNERLKLTKELIDQQQIINTVNANYNIVDQGVLSFNKTVKYPILLILLFLLAFFIKYLFNTLKKFADN